jgi:hypothetical protein
MQLWKKLWEVLLSVLPVVAIVLLLHFTIAPLGLKVLLEFLFGAALLILGLALFHYGADTGVVFMGEMIGEFLTKSRSLWLAAVFGLVVGFSVTFAEPDLQVLASQVFLASGGGVSTLLLMFAVSIGVGLFVSISLLRVAVRIPLPRLLVFCYAIVFLLAIVVSFVSPDFFAIAFDAGGVTTGPMTVPFMLALGVGAASVRANEDAPADSFGMVALGSVGPIIAVLVLALFARRIPTAGALYSASAQSPSQQGMWAFFLYMLKKESGGVSIALLPTAVIFAVMQIFFLKLPRRQVRKVIVGMGYMFMGLVLLLTGVNLGFSPAAGVIGKLIAQGGGQWLLIPVGLVLGFTVVGAEPAVHVLAREVEEVSGGYIKRTILLGALCISVAVSVGLAMIRVLTGVNLWWFLVPGYLAAFLLMRKAPPLFCSIAFDSGGVATGPMTVTFILAMATGASEHIGGDVLADAFGLVALVAMTPLVTIQAMGWLFSVKERRIRQLQHGSVSED